LSDKPNYQKTEGKCKCQIAREGRKGACRWTDDLVMARVFWGSTSGDTKGKFKH